jgi:hypothetical protein
MSDETEASELDEGEEKDNLMKNANMKKELLQTLAFYQPCEQNQPWNICHPVKNVAKNSLVLT